MTAPDAASATLVETSALPAPGSALPFLFVLNDKGCVRVRRHEANNESCFNFVSCFFFFFILGKFGFGAGLGFGGWSDVWAGRAGEGLVRRGDV